MQHTRHHAENTRETKHESYELLLAAVLLVLIYFHRDIEGAAFVVGARGSMIVLKLFT
jgi:hypothetical protein